MQYQSTQAALFVGLSEASPHPIVHLMQVGHLEHLVKLYSRGDVPRCDWLDMLTFKVRIIAALPHQCQVQLYTYRSAVTQPSMGGKDMLSVGCYSCSASYRNSERDQSDWS